MSQNIGPWLAFLGGILAFFSPCFLPLVPAYLIYITGLSFDEVKNARLRTVLHSLTFIAGFTLVFTLLGVTATLVGQFFYDLRIFLRITAGFLIIILGLYLMRVLRLPFLDVERRITVSAKPAGYLGTFLVGIVFALGWSPCVGPLLAGILLYASQAGTLARGTGLLVCFSLGLGLPLVLFSSAVGFSLSLLKSIEKHLKTIHFICGILLLLIGGLLVTNYFEAIMRFFASLALY